MRPIKWKKPLLAFKLEHLAGIQFPNLGQPPVVDVLIGLDYSDLRYSYRDVRGKPGVPIARLTSFRLDMCRKSKMTDKNKHYNRTSFVHILENRADIGNIVKKFWEIENVKTQ